jgi:sensor histidine kinase YesM
MYCLSLYFNAHIAMNWAMHNLLNSIWRVPLVIVLEISLYIVLSFCGDHMLAKLGLLGVKMPAVITKTYALNNCFRTFNVVGLSTGYYFLLTYNRERKKSEELERQKFYEIISRQKAEQELSKAQNAFLKAQINPHFLFNTLDFIYHNILALSPVAADAIVTLAEMMRFAIDADKMGEFILLGDELDQVLNLRYLNQLRKSQETAFELLYDEETRDMKFIPLVLLTLTENIFKHGDLSENKKAILRIFIAEGMLNIHSGNMSHGQQRTHSHKTGLANLEKRLRHAYGDAALFSYGNNADGYFNVSVKVPLNLLS